MDKWTHMRLHAYAFMHTQTHMCMHMHIHTETHKHMYTYIHNHAYVGTQICTLYTHTCTHMTTQGPTYKGTGIPIQGHMQRHICAHTCRHAHTGTCMQRHTCAHRYKHVHTTGTHSGMHTLVVISRADLLGSAGGGALSTLRPSDSEDKA